MQIASSRRSPQPKRSKLASALHPKTEDHSLASAATHSLLEGADSFLHAAHLGEAFHRLQSGAKIGIGAFSLIRGTKGLIHGKSVAAKLEASASVGLGVASFASFLPGGLGSTVNIAAQSARGVAETALGIVQLKDSANSPHKGRESLVELSTRPRA